MISMGWLQGRLIRLIMTNRPLRTAVGFAQFQKRLYFGLLGLLPMRGIMIELTNHCNLSCTMCGNRLMKRKKGFMSRETFDAFIDGIPDGSLTYICLFGVGEPLLNPNAAYFSKRAREKADLVCISTNGIPMRNNDALMENLILSGANHFHFSGDGYNEETYEQVRVNARFRDFIDVLRRFKEARDRLNPDLSIELLYCLTVEHTIDEIRQAYETYHEYVDEITFKPLNNQSNTKIPYDPNKPIFGYSYYFPHRLRPCRSLWGAPLVMWDGRVSACARNYENELIVGDVKEDSIEKIWKGSAYRDIRKSHLTGKIPPRCRGCSDLHENPTKMVDLNMNIRKKANLPDYRVLG